MQKHKRLLSAHEDMMGYLKALASDNDFWNEATSRENTMTIYNRKTIDQITCRGYNALRGVPSPPERQSRTTTLC